MKGFVSVVFPFFQKTQLVTKICTFTTNILTDEVVNKQQKIVYIPIDVIVQGIMPKLQTKHWNYFKRLEKPS